MAPTQVHWSASVHDDNQVELTFDYRVEPLVGDEPVRDDPRPRFGVDLYLIAPAALDLDPDTYSKSRFLADLTHRMRLHAPVMPGFSEGRVPALERYLGLDLDFTAKAAVAPRTIQQVKLFGNYVNLRLKEVFVGDQPRPGLKYKRDLKDTVALLDAFRERYADALREPSLLYDEEVRDAVLWVERYLSDRMRAALSRVALVGKRKALRALARESEHEVAEVPLAEDQDPQAIEAYFHRYGELKKYVAEVLYLDRVERHRDRWYRNLAAASGAAIAALFAETARYYNTAATGTTDFGLRVAFFLGLAVVAYVFKDRLKDLSKEYFGRRVMSSVPDRDSELGIDFVSGEDHLRRIRVAEHHEWVRHLRSAALPDDVAYVWERCGAADYGIDRDVLRYGKIAWIDPHARDELGFDELAVKDILRLDLSAFLSHLDNPLKELALYDSEEGSVVVKAPKVYHLDIVLRIERLYAQQDGDCAERQLEVVRVVLDKNGIVRLEHPVPRNRYQYDEAVG